MDFEIYCDESAQDLFKGTSQDGIYTLIGGVWIKAEDRKIHKAAINQLRERHNLHGEFKWKRVSNSRLDFYLDIVKWFFESEIRFRTLILRAEELNAVKFHNSDHELMYYKFYYQLLHHWILDFNSYKIFVDTKTNRLHNRLGVLQKCLNNSNLTSTATVQALPSNQLDLIQVADVLIGAVSYKFHKRDTSQAKLQIINQIETCWNREIQPTTKSEEKFNIFRFRSEGGW